MSDSAATPGLMIPGIGGMKPKQNLTSEFATRKVSIDFYSLNLYLPNPDPVLKKTGADLRVYRDLTSYGRVWSGITSRKSGVMSLEWELERGKCRNREYREIEALFNRLDLERIFAEILDAVLYGFQPLEVIWAKGSNGFILPTDVVGKPQEWFTFGPQQNELRLRTKWNWINGEEVIPRKFLLARNYPTYRNPYGEALLSRCFWPVAFARGGWKFWTIFAEKYGMPWLIGKHAPGAEQGEISRIADMLEGMVQDAIAVIPDNASLEVVEAANKAANADFYRGMIQEAKSEISEVLVGHAGAAESTPGKLGSETAALAVRQDIIDSDRKLVEQTLNQLIDWIYQLNFGEGERPRFRMFSKELVDLTLAQRDGELSRNCGVSFSAAYLQRAYGFEEGDIVSVGAESGERGAASGKNVGAIHESPVRESPVRESPVRESPGQAQTIKEQAAEFAEDTGKRSTVNVQQAQQDIDNLMNSMTTVGANGYSPLQKQMETLLKPVLTALEGAVDYAEAQELLLQTFPTMTDAALERNLERMIFLAEIRGRMKSKSEG